MLSVSPVDLGVSLSPRAAHGRAHLVGAETLLLEASGLLAGGSESAELSVSVLVGHDPVDAGVASDGLVVGVHADDLVELEGGVLSNPVGVKNTEVSGSASNSLFGGRSVGSLLLELADTKVDGLTDSLMAISKRFPAASRLTT